MNVPSVGFKLVEMVSVAVAIPPVVITLVGVMVTVMPVVLPRITELSVTGCEKPLSEAMLMVKLFV